MSALLECLDRLSGEPLGTVVHINPSLPEAIERYAALGSQRVVFVSIDPDMLPLLHQAAAEHAGFEVCEAAVAAAPGPAHWLRYNVPTLNGLLEPTGLKQFYPRLQLLERVSVNTVSLQALLDRLQIATSAVRPNLLVLDAPGTETVLLESLSAKVLASFAWVVVRGARQGLYQSGVAAGAALSLLQQHYRSMHESGNTEPLWPTTLLRHDATAAERTALATRLEALQAQLHDVTAERDEWKRRADLQRVNDELREKERQAQLDTINQAKAAVDKTVDELSTRLETLRKAHDEQATQFKHAQFEADTATRQLAHRVSEVESLNSQLAQWKARFDEVARARDDLDRLAADREARLALSIKECEEQTHWHHENAKWAKTLKAENESLNGVRDLLGVECDKLKRDRDEARERLSKLQSRLDEQATRQHRLDAEILRAQAQLDLVKEVLLGEKNF